MLKPGDLIKDMSDGDVGLVLSSPRRRDAVVGPVIETVEVKWGSLTQPCELDIIMVRRGDVEILNTVS
tara:strand:+ start:670 stop:873 length:204 start_codon:yes stop_codon:yes gene_type:complete